MGITHWYQTIPVFKNIFFSFEIQGEALCLKCGEKRDEIIAEVLAIMVAENIDSFSLFQKRKQMLPWRFAKLVKRRKIRIPEITVNDDFIGF